MQVVKSSTQTARLAGLLYLFVVLAGIFSLAYVPSKLIDWADAATTYRNIQASETLFRLGIVAGIICYTAFLLLPFGYLVYKSGFLPKILGILLMAGCFGYLMNFLGGFLFPQYGSLGIARFVSLPATLGEIGTCLWLLIIGIKNNKAHGA
jgi:hypothetical protein